jgi:transcriptional regulator GlxA family with amidase domain
MSARREIGMSAAQEILTTGRKPSRRAAAVRKAAEYIEQNSTERILLQELAALANLSPCRFATVFRRQIGLPPHRYLCHVRVQHAVVLLRSGVPLAMAASEAGFFDQSHLSRHFKSIYGVTPGKYLSQVGPLTEQPPMHATAGQQDNGPVLRAAC